MTIEMRNDYKAGEFICVPYTFVRSLGVEIALTLSQVIAEYNYSHNNGLNYFSDFLFNPQRMAMYLGMNIKRLCEVLRKLEELDFILLLNADISETCYIRVNQDKIIKFKQDEELENYYGNRSDGLKCSQNPMNKAADFCPSLEKIRTYMNEHLSDPNAIPLIIYTYLNNLIQVYEESSGKCVLDLKEVKSYIPLIAKDKEPKLLLTKLFENIC